MASTFGDGNQRSWVVVLLLEPVELTPWSRKHTHWSTPVIIGCFIDQHTHTNKFAHLHAARVTYHLEERRGAEQLYGGVRQLPAAAKVRRRERLVQGLQLGERVHQPSHVVFGATVRVGNACMDAQIAQYGRHVVLFLIVVLRV